MILIAHRGNHNSKQLESENSPEFIQTALDAGFDVEIDVWLINDHWYLGHDEPTHEVDVSFLQDSRLWCHAKSAECLVAMLDAKVHCFWHNEDAHTLTSRGYIWTYPGEQLTSRSIAVMPELSKWTAKDLKICSGICSDTLSNYI